MTPAESPGRLFTERHAWTGAFYELYLELGPRDDAKLLAALAAVWAHPSLDGCYAERDTEPADQAREVADLTRDGWCGVATLPNGVRVACSSGVIRFGDGEGGPDVVSLGLPMGSLGRAYPVGAYPFGDGGPWQDELDAFLVGVGRAVFAVAPFRIGSVGHELDGDCFPVAEMTAVPDGRPAGILWPTPGGLEYWGRTR